MYGGGSLGRGQEEQVSSSRRVEVESEGGERAAQGGKAGGFM